MDAALAQSTPIDPKDLIASADVRRLVEGMVRRRVPASEVDDVVQTVLCDALASDKLPDDAEQLRKWIAGITRHKVADFHRKGGRVQHVELPEAVEGEDAPLSAREWARWAEQQAEGDPDKERTLGWMAREGEGEKLAHIAEDEDLPATQVRQRVSRLRRFMKQRWAAELAAVAAIVILALVAWRLLREDEPIAVPEPVPEILPEPKALEAERMRAEAFEHCENEAWQDCLDDFDAAKQLDSEGDERPEIQRARERAAGALEQQREREQNDEQSKPDPRLEGPPTKVAPPGPSPKNVAPPTPPKQAPKKALPQKKQPVPTKPTPQSTFEEQGTPQQAYPQQKTEN